MMVSSDEEGLRLAFKKAREGIGKGQSPFGACIVDQNGMVLSVTHNTVLEASDPTAHAEINAIREASKRKGTWDLTGCTIFSTTEPCPMCFFAIHWARIHRIVSSTYIDDVAKLGFDEVHLGNKFLAEKGKLDVEIRSGLLRDEGLALLKEWERRRLAVY